MELLPIIYKSLSYAGILALVVIIVSFVAFRFRKKYGSIPSQEVHGKERNKKVKVTNPDKKSKTEKKHHPKVQTRSRQKKSSSTQRERRTSVSKRETRPSISRRDKKVEPINSELYKKPTRDTHRKRIEIINPAVERNSDKEQSSQSNTKFHPMKIDSRRNDWN